MVQEVEAWLCEICLTKYDEEASAEECEASGVPPVWYEPGEKDLLGLGTPGEVRVVLLETRVERRDDRDGGGKKHVRMWRVEYQVPGGGFDWVRQDSLGLGYPISDILRNLGEA